MWPRGVPLHLPRWAEQVDCAAKFVGQAYRASHRDVEREFDRLPVLLDKQIAGKRRPAKPFVKRDQRWLADKQRKVNVVSFPEEFDCPIHGSAGISSPSEVRVSHHTSDTAHLHATVIPTSLSDHYPGMSTGLALDIIPHNHA